MEDRRVKRTHKAINDAVWSLMQENNFEELSVNDICERAQVSRTTFYYYYEDKYDWLEKELGVLFMSHFTFIGAADDNVLHFSELLTRTYQNVADNLQYYETLSTNGMNNMTFSERIEKIMISVFKKQLSPSGARLSVEDDLKLHLSVSALLGVLQWWLSNGLPITPKELAELVCSIRFGIDSNAGSGTT